jgi:glycosyltransferase involved in cell wall biosynthesis
MYFDVVIASSHYPYDVIPAMLMKLRFPSSKLVVYFHSLDIPYQSLSFRRVMSVMSNYFGAILIRMCADLVFTINRYTRNFLLLLGLEEGKIFLTNNGVEIKAFVPVPKKKIFDLCFIGRHVKHKGIYDLLTILEILRKTKPSIKLAICGHGEETSRINELVRMKRLENNALLLGFVQESKKYEILCSSRVFVFPSYVEGWGIAIAEAMVCSLPVIAYNLPIYREIFGDKLITVPLGDVNAMAGQIIFLLNNPKIAQEIGNSNKEFIKKYSWEEVANKEINLITALLNRQHNALYSGLMEMHQQGLG